ncbi:hypothetical protein BAY59_09715 [Prauserella coralliicola]|nr:hypothetical protein BAY59_09715 [Prauserella coralliicola]
MTTGRMLTRSPRRLCARSPRRRRAFLAPRFKVPDTADRLWFCFGMNAWRTLTVDCQWSYDDAERTLRHQALSILTEP